METHPGSVNYFSHVTQNEMISITSNLITEMISDQVRDAKFFSVGCDEVTSGKKAYMSAILRYVADFTIQERCMKLVRIASLKGKSLAEVIVNVLADLHLELCSIVGMGFDGAANMSGKDDGVQIHLKQAGAVFAMYFHCFAHR